MGGLGGNEHNAAGGVLLDDLFGHKLNDEENSSYLVTISGGTCSYSGGGSVLRSPPGFA